MKDRFKEAAKLAGVKIPEIANAVGMKPDTFRRALSRGKINEGYLVLIEKHFKISKEWIKNGLKPILIDQKDILITKIEEDSYSILEKIDPEKIVAYILLKEKMFMDLYSFNLLIEKLKASKRLNDIAEKHSKQQ